MSYRHSIFCAALLWATPLAAQTLDVSGRYAVEGRNADGSAYSGQLSLTQNDDTVAASWQVGAERYRGSGEIEGRVITLDWGDRHPIYYVVAENRILHGTWADGHASERARPLD